MNFLSVKYRLWEFIPTATQSKRSPIQFSTFISALVVHKTSQTVPITSFLSLKPSVGRQDQRFRHGGVQGHCYVKSFTSY